MNITAASEAGLLGRAGHLYHHLLSDLRDSRVDSWPLMDSPWPTVTLCGLYYFIVRFAGIRLMKDRTAYECRTAMFVYNVFQTFFSLWIFTRLGGFWLTGKYSWTCQPVDYTNSKDGLNAANIVWWYFFSKFTDFMDSFFMVLKKKNNQLTSLHVIHHMIMPMCSWIFLKWVGGGHSTFFMFLNMGVHVVMYFYYLMSGLGPQVQKYLWWKRYITEMQLLQFVSFSLHALIPLFASCSYPTPAAYFIIFLGVLFFTLFTNFYIKSYTRKASLKNAKAD